MKRYAIFFFIILFGILPLCTPAQNQWGYYCKDTYSNNSKHYWDNTLKSLSVLCFTGITISKNACNIPSFSNEHYLFTKAQQYHIAIIPHVTFASISHGVSFLKAREWDNVITTLVNALHENAWAGIHFDFEYLPAAYSNAYVQFLKKFRSIAPDIKLSAALFPQIEFHKEHAAFHNYEKLSPFFNEVVIMCYDYYNPKTKPGPVTDMQWTMKNIEYALRFFKSHQIWLGVPAYGYMWKNGKYHSVITTRTIPEYTSIYSNYRHSSGTLCIEYIKNNDMFIALVSDTVTIKKLQHLATLYSLKGTALWRLGFE